MIVVPAVNVPVTFFLQYFHAGKPGTSEKSEAVIIAALPLSVKLPSAPAGTTRLKNVVLALTGY
ncbi:hypothetical protein D3C87_2020480 [compost metagenome]